MAQAFDQTKRRLSPFRSLVAAGALALLLFTPVAQVRADSSAGSGVFYGDGFSFKPPAGWKAISNDATNTAGVWNFAPAQSRSGSVPGAAELVISKGSRTGVASGPNTGPQEVATYYRRSFESQVSKWKSFCKSEGLKIPAAWAFEIETVEAPMESKEAVVAALKTKVPTPRGLKEHLWQWSVFDGNGTIWEMHYSGFSEEFTRHEKAVMASLATFAPGAAARTSKDTAGAALPAGPKGPRVPAGPKPKGATR